jgi:hypothetical protein
VGEPTTATGQPGLQLIEPEKQFLLTLRDLIEVIGPVLLVRSLSHWTLAGVAVGVEQVEALVLE